MEISKRNTVNIYDLARRIQSLKPGHQMVVSGDILLAMAPPAPLLGLGGPTWSPCDQVLEKIAGSAFEFKAWENMQGNFVFERLRKPLSDGSRTYVSPDRRHHFDGPFACIYYPKTK